MVFQALTTSLTCPHFLGSCGISQAGEAVLGETKQETEERSLGKAQVQRGGGERAQAPPPHPRLTLPKAPDPSPRSPLHNSHYLVCNFSVCL